MRKLTSAKKRIFKRMEKAGSVAIKRGLLKWLMNATLVLSVIAFSGYASQSKSPSFEPARTELKQNTSANAERTVRFQVIHEASSHFAFLDPAKNFHCCRCHNEHQIEVKLKGHVGTCTIKDQSFLIHYFTYNSEVSDTDRPRG
jgi:hypothetical protein